MNDNETTNYMSKEKTAVEWLVEVFDLEMFDTFHLDKINQAKQMEKEQMNKMYDHAVLAILDGNGHGQTFDEYYEFKYGKND